MSWQDSKWAIEQKTGTASAKAVLLVIAEASKGGRCFLSHIHIGIRAEVDRRTVVRQMRGLEERGLIRRQRRFDRAGHRTTDLIILQREKIVTEDGGESEGDDVCQDDSPSPSQRDGLSLGGVGQGDKSDLAKVTSTTRLGDRLSQEPILNRDSEPEDMFRPIATAAKPLAENKRRPHDTEAFRAWWPHYPHRVKRPAAEKAFAKVMGTGAVSLDELISAAAIYSLSDKVRRGFPMNPTTWLNGECWADEPAAAADQPGSALDYAIRSLT